MRTTKLFSLIIFFLGLSFMMPEMSFSQDAGEKTEQTEKKPKRKRRTETKKTDKKEKKGGFFSRIFGGKKKDKQKGVASNSKKKKGFFGRLLNKGVSAPDTVSDWHADAIKFYNVKPVDFLQFGYVKVDLKGEEKWVPFFVWRHFKPVRRQYEHVLVIEGRPTKLPQTKGITLNQFGLEVINEGFEYNLPTFPSVDRKQKSLDEVEFVKLAEQRILDFGFISVKWVDRIEDESREMAEEWVIETN